MDRKIQDEISAHMKVYAKKRRKELGLTLEGLADKMGTSKSHIWQLENQGFAQPTLFMCLSLCEAIGCGINDLTGLDVAKQEFTAAEIRLVIEHRKIFPSR